MERHLKEDILLRALYLWDSYLSNLLYLVCVWGICPFTEKKVTIALLSVFSISPCVILTTENTHSLVLQFPLFGNLRDVRDPLPHYGTISIT